MKKYDVIVIGAGAGNIVVDAAVAAGKSCALVEKGRFGGTCLNHGCIPTKVMIHLADLLRDIEEGQKIGLNVLRPSVNWPVLKRRVREKIDDANLVKRFYQETDGLTVYEGTATFTNSHNLEVALHSGGTETITAPKIILATGGKTMIPPIKGLENVGYITSETFFGHAFPDNPYKSLIIVGGGAIGTEFAHLFSSFGTRQPRSAQRASRSKGRRGCLGGAVGAFS